MEKRYKLELIGITFNQIESGVYALILQQEGTTRRIPIIIGFPEAQAIECKLQEVKTPRPLTHDTMVKTLEAFGLTLMEVEIKKLPNGVFAADLVLTDGNIEKIIDARSSDAIALAIRTGSPIYTTESVLQEAGFDASENKIRSQQNGKSKNQSKNPKSGLEALSSAQLAEAMAKAVEEEDYEEAARIKAELDNRKEKG